MGVADCALPYPLVEHLAGAHQLTSFFETGTHLGGSSGWAAQRFATVRTVERSPILYAMARVNLAGLANVELMFGDSRAALAQALPDLPPTLFWLDAHWSGGETAGEHDTECPLLGELAAIAPALDRHFVLIDDARMFAMPPPPPHDAEAWPSLPEIFDALRSRHRPYIAIHRDVIIAVPAHAKPGLVAYLQANQPALGAAATRP